MDPAEAIATWFPVAVQPAARGAQVLWIERARVAIRGGILDEEIAASLAAGGGQVLETDLAHLRRLARDRRCRHPPTAIVFHIARSGSTLLLRALGAATDGLILGEPRVVNDLLRLRMTGRRSADAEAMRGLVHGLARRPAGGAGFLKLTSWNLFEPSIFAAAFPRIPRLVLYRDPAEVLALLRSNPPPWLVRRRAADPSMRVMARRLGLTGGEGGRPTAEDLVVPLRRMYQAVLRTPGARLVNYDELTPARVAELLRSIGAPTRRDLAARLERVFGQDAKARDGRAFSRAREDLTLTPAERALVERHLAAPYAALEARRLGRARSSRR